MPLSSDNSHKRRRSDDGHTYNLRAPPPCKKNIEDKAIKILMEQSYELSIFDIQPARNTPTSVGDMNANRQALIYHSCTQAKGGVKLAENDFRFSVLILELELQLLQDRVYGTVSADQDMIKARGVAEQEFARLSNIDVKHIRNLRQLTCSFSHVARQRQGLGLLCLLGVKTRDMWRRMKKQTISNAVSHCLLRDREFDSRLEKFQSYACSRIIELCSQCGIQQSELYQGEHIFAKHFQTNRAGCPDVVGSVVQDKAKRTYKSSSFQGQESRAVVLHSDKHIAADTSTLRTIHTGSSNHYPRPQLQMMTVQYVPDTSDSIRFAISGDVDKLIDMFERGLASPYDVSVSRGFSMVRWALYGGMHNYRTVQFLIKEGAPVDEESYKHVWDFAFREKCNSTELVELRCITLNPTGKYRHTDWLVEQDFPLVHQIILGRSKKVLEAELCDNPGAVHVKDAMGRTALDWATARAQLSDMKTLIFHGSSLDTVDKSGRATLLHAVDSHSDDVLRTLLESGADPNPKVSNHSSPLNAACFGGLPGMAYLLIKHGANLDTCNPEGRTPLQGVARQDTDCAQQCASTLLDQGADPTFISNNGSSAFEIAIINNSHKILMLFIKRLNGSRCLDGTQLLPNIAKFADARTISIIASSNLLQFILPREDGFAKHSAIFRSRVDYDEMLGNAFRILCLGQ